MMKVKEPKEAYYFCNVTFFPKKDRYMVLQIKINNKNQRKCKPAKM